MKKYFSWLVKLTVLGIVIASAFLTLPFTAENKHVTYAEYGEGAGCNAAGRPGVCWDRASRGCGTYYDSGNYCPGDDSVQCCVNSQVACSAGPGGACHNSSSGGFGNTYSCSGTWYSGYCPGPSDVRCCVPAPTATPVPAIPPPTNVSASCNASATQVTVNWTRPSGYTYSYVRIYDETTDSVADYTNVITGSSYQMTAIPGHRYSYWVHTTNSAGSPWSIAVPPSRTAFVTCTPPTPTPFPVCQTDSPPNNTIVSTGNPTRASAVRNGNTSLYGSQFAVDGLLDAGHYWDSGAAEPQWIEIDLGAPQEVAGLKMYANQSASGQTVHQVLAGPNPNPTTVIRTQSCSTSNGGVINVNFSPLQANIRYVRVNTTYTPSSTVAWNEISVYGSAPGVQSNTPGVIFSGDGTTDFGAGDASTTNWVVGGLTYPETYVTSAHQSTLSYQFLLEKIMHAGITRTNLTTYPSCSSLSNCTLPSNLASGVYVANGPVNLNGYTFPNARNFIFLINGDLRVNGPIVVPNGSTAFFSSSRDINVSTNVGTSTNLFPLPAGQLQGIYAADRDFNIEGINDCLVGVDKMLNIEGAIITNAAGNGGKFRTKRDLCGDNPQIPSLTIRLRLDIILNLPVVLMRQKTLFREDAP